MKMILLILLLSSFAYGQSVDIPANFTSCWGAECKTNLVKNPSARDNSKYKTAVNFTADRDTTASTNVDYRSSWALQSSALNGYVEFDLNPAPEDLKSGWCKFAGVSKGDASLYEAQITDGSGNRLNGVQLQNTTGFAPFVMGYQCGDNGTRKVRFKQTLAGTAPLINAGQLFYGRGDGMVNVPKGSSWVGTAFTVGTTNCAWSRTNTTLGAFTADADCPVPAVSGNMAAPATKIPGFIIPNAPPGIYNIRARGLFTNSAATYGSWAFSDGTTTEFAGISGSATTNTTSGIIEAKFTLTSQRTNWAVQVYGSSPSGSVDISPNTAGIRDLIFDVYYYPLTGSYDNVIAAAQANTPRTAHTPTWTGFGTPTNVECFKWTDGEYGYLDCKMTAGTTTATEGRMSLPSEWTVATWSQGIKQAGVGFLSVANSMPTILIESATSYLTFGFQGTGNAGTQKVNGSSLMNSGQILAFLAKVPLANRIPNGGALIGPGLIVSDSPNYQFQIESAEISSTGVKSGMYSGWLSGNCSVASTNQYTCSFTKTQPVNPECWVQGIGSAGWQNNRNAISTTSVRFDFLNNAGNPIASAFTLFCKMQR